MKQFAAIYNIYRICFRESMSISYLIPKGELPPPPPVIAEALRSQVPETGISVDHYMTPTQFFSTKNKGNPKSLKN